MFHPICPRRPVDLEYTSVSGEFHQSLSLAFQPPRLLYGRAANYGSFIVLSEGLIFSFQGTPYSFEPLPVWGVALAVTIVYLKTERFFRRSHLRFLQQKPEVLLPVLNKTDRIFAVFDFTKSQKIFCVFQKKKAFPDIGLYCRLSRKAFTL